MKSQVLHTVWCHISCEAAGEFWHWSLSGLKGLTCRRKIGRFTPQDLMGEHRKQNASTIIEIRYEPVIACYYLKKTLLQTTAFLTNILSTKNMNKANRCQCANIANIGFVLADSSSLMFMCQQVFFHSKTFWTFVTLINKFEKSI